MKKKNNAHSDFENQMWNSVKMLQGDVDVSEYKRVVLGLIFLKYISDTSQERRITFKEAKDTEYDSSENCDESLEANVFFVPEKARWAKLQSSAEHPEIGKLVDGAMLAVEKENPLLRGVLCKNYAYSSLDRHCLGKLISIISNIKSGNNELRRQEIFSYIYEYFLSRFVLAEKGRGRTFYTPQCVIKLLVGILKPQGRVYDPCFGFGGMFVQCKRFFEEQNGGSGDITFYGQESNAATWRLSKMNLTICGISARIGQQHADSFHNDIHNDLQADVVIANPPFNVRSWGGENIRKDPRWKYGVPPIKNANYAWIQHFIHRLSPNGIAGFVMANGSMSSNTVSERTIRKNIIEADLVDCIIALPAELFYTTRIPVCLWFLSRNKKNGKSCDRSRQTLFIDSSKLGSNTVNRGHKEISNKEIDMMINAYYTWCGKKDFGKYKDVKGFCRSVNTDEIRKHGYSLVPSRYVGTPRVESSSASFEKEMIKLSATLYKQFAEVKNLEAAITKNLETLGYGKQYNCILSGNRKDMKNV